MDTNRRNFLKQTATATAAVALIPTVKAMETTKFSSGKLFVNGKIIDVDTLVWNEHPVCKGVALKHLIKGEATGNQLSCHLVRIAPGCEISLHNHAGKTELHEVLNGSGYCLVENTQIDYEEGFMDVIPADKNHIVRAGDNGLFLMAKFFPALF